MDPCFFPALNFYQLCAVQYRLMSPNQKRINALFLGRCFHLLPLTQEVEWSNADSPRATRLTLHATSNHTQPCVHSSSLQLHVWRFHMIFRMKRICAWLILHATSNHTQSCVHLSSFQLHMLGIYDIRNGKKGAWQMYRYRKYYKLLCLKAYLYSQGFGKIRSEKTWQCACLIILIDV